MKEKIAELNELFRFKHDELLALFLREYEGRIALASSLSIEDQVITDMICKINKNTKIFTLDTGRMFKETYDTIQRTNARYDIKIKIYFPNNTAVEKLTSEKGMNSFYESIENRKECCGIRKMEPLKRAFEGLEVWISGLRKEQSVTRSDMQLVEWDEANNLIKLNPLINYSEQQTWEYIRKHNVPYNTLQDKGFLSIGCEPCTRAVQAGEDIRAGRWWWESPEHKECGLHVQPKH